MRKHFTHSYIFRIYTFTDILRSLWGLLNFLTLFFTIFFERRGTAMATTYLNFLSLHNINKEKCIYIGVGWRDNSRGQRAAYSELGFWKAADLGFQNRDSQLILARVFTRIFPFLFIFFIIIIKSDGCAANLVKLQLCPCFLLL